MPPKRGILNWGGGELGPYPSIKKINFWMHWDLVWDLDPDPSTFFRIWIMRHRGGVNTWTIEISFEGTPIESKARAWLRLRISMWDLIRDADREEDERKNRALEDRALHSRSLDRLQQQQQLLVHLHAEEICTPLSLALGCSNCLSRFLQVWVTNKHTLRHLLSWPMLFVPKDIGESCAIAVFYDFHEGFWVRHRCFSFSETWGRGIGRRGMYNSYCY